MGGVIAGRQGLLAGRLIVRVSVLHSWIRGGSQSVVDQLVGAEELGVVLVFYFSTLDPGLIFHAYGSSHIWNFALYSQTSLRCQFVHGTSSKFSDQA